MKYTILPLTITNEMIGCLGLQYAWRDYNLKSDYAAAKYWSDIGHWRETIRTFGVVLR